jgi:tetratricopeptide (TPR) repeat protein
MHADEATGFNRIWRSGCAQLLLVGAVLALASFAAYWPARNFEFLNFDDKDTVVNSVPVRNGLNWHGIVWAFQNRHMGNWQPVTTMSHMLDCTLFGLRPGPSHLVNVLFHSANTSLLFLVLWRLTGSQWRSAFVAALFALHPLHVESVAWVSERKDVLSAFFFMLTLATYAKYVSGVRCQVSRESNLKPYSLARPEDSTLGRSSAPRYYALTLFFFGLGLMCKPMLVTVPIVLILLDVWPLRRFELNTEHWKLNTLRPLVLEKLPFFALAILFSAVTMLTQYRSNAMSALANWPLSERIANAFVAYVRYFGKAFWPQGLLPFYPRVSHWPVWEIGACVAVLVVISFVAFRLARRFPYLFVEWLWFLVTLVPVIGLVQVGTQSMADRYTYLPLIGLFVVIGWGMGDLWKRTLLPKLSVVVPACALLAACFMVTRAQVRHWQSSITLFSHALKVMPNLPLAHNNLGSALYDQKRYDEAIPHLQDALRLKPGYVDAYNNLGMTYWRLGREQDAIEQFSAVLKQGPDAKAFYNLGVLLFTQGKVEEARQCVVSVLTTQPDSAEARNNLGNVLATQGKLEEAGAEFAAAVRFAPDLPEARLNLARTLAGKGAIEDAENHYAQALRLRPDFAEAHLGLAKLLEQAGRLPEAADHYSAAVQLQPDLAEAHNDLSNLAARLNNRQAAFAHGQRAVQLKPEWPEAHFNLANGYFLLGELDDAVTHYSDALRLNTNYFEARQNLAFALEKLGWDKEATRHYQELVRQRPDFAPAYNRLAVVLAKQGRFEEASKAADEGIRLASASGQHDLANQMRENVTRYKAGKP